MDKMVDFSLKIRLRSNALQRPIKLWSPKSVVYRSLFLETDQQTYRELFSFPFSRNTDQWSLITFARNSSHSDHFDNPDHLPSCCSGWSPPASGRCSSASAHTSPRPCRCPAPLAGSAGATTTSPARWWCRPEFALLPVKFRFRWKQKPDFVVYLPTDDPVLAHGHCENLAKLKKWLN